MYHTEDPKLYQRELLNSEPKDNTPRSVCYQFIKDMSNLLIPISIFAGILTIVLIFL